jgi:hypothetical protein
MYHEKSIELDIYGYDEYITFHNWKNTHWFYNSCTYIIFSFLYLSWLYRVIFICSSKYETYTFKKRIIN